MNEWTPLAVQENFSFYATRASSGSLATDRYFNTFPSSANCQLQLSFILVLELDGHGALPLDSAKEAYHFYWILFLVCWFIVPLDLLLIHFPLVCSQNIPEYIFVIYFVYYFHRNNGRNTNQTKPMHLLYLIHFRGIGRVRKKTHSPCSHISQMELTLAIDYIKGRQNIILEIQLLFYLQLPLFDFCIALSPFPQEMNISKE